MESGNTNGEQRMRAWRGRQLLPSAVRAQLARMRRLALLALLILAACGEELASAPDASITVVPDATAAPDATIAPDAEEPPKPSLRCPATINFPTIVAGTSTAASAKCEAIDGEVIITGVELEAPFTVTSTVELTLAFAFTPTIAGDSAAVARVRYADGVASIELRAHADAPIDWDPPIPTATCAADHEAPLLDRALALTNLDRAHFGFTTADLASSTFYANGDLDDEMKLSWLFSARARPHRAGCVAASAADAIDLLIEQPHPVSSIIRHAAALVDRPVPEDMHPFDPRVLPGSFDDALAAICNSVCPPATGSIPADLQEKLAPILWAIASGLDVRAMRDPGATLHDAAWWQQYGGFSLLISTSRERWDPTNDADRAYLHGLDRARLYGAAAQIAFAVENAELRPFVGAMNVRFDLTTPAGAIRVRDGASDHYNEDATPLLFFLDLGGDDVHEDDLASNRTAANAVSIAIDLAGDDRYEYRAVATPYDRPGLLPADDGGRYAGNMQYGNVTYSRHFRQGAAENGIAMLFDLGGGNDRYQSLQGSQGYAHQGAGVLFDDGGDDHYLSESGSQGAAQFGIGLLIDKGNGADEHRAFTFSQGFGFVQGAGILYDGGGNDTYVCDHGDPAQGGIALYFSPQLPNAGNTSLCQGAGFGKRGDVARTFFSGGVGILRDRAGDDSYEASVYAQGTAYWQGAGILADGDGSDLFDAYWYVQGGAAHYSLGILTNAGSGHDIFNGTRAPVNVHLGAGHDFSTGVYIGEASDAEYHLAQLAGGASHCNAVGLFVDNGGDDQYFASSEYGSGSGSVGEECIADRPNAVSIGVMIDAGGTDAYAYPASMFTLPSEGGTWGQARAGLPVEHGAGLDASGETGVHASFGP